MSRMITTFEIPFWCLGSKDGVPTSVDLGNEPDAEFLGLEVDDDLIRVFALVPVNTDEYVTYRFTLRTLVGDAETPVGAVSRRKQGVVQHRVLTVTVIP